MSFRIEFMIKLVPYHPAKQQEVTAKQLHLSVVWLPWNQWGLETPTPKEDFKLLKLPFHLQHTHPQLIHQCLGRPYQPPQVTAPSVHTLSHHSIKIPIGYNGTPQIHLKSAPSRRRSPPKSNTPIPSLIPLIIPMAFGSTQPFCHNTDCGQTDRQTDRQMDRPADGIEWLFDHIRCLRSLYVLESTPDNNHLWTGNGDFWPSSHRINSLNQSPKFLTCWWLCRRTTVPNLVQNRPWGLKGMNEV